MLTWILDLVGRVAHDVTGTLRADWPYLLASILAAAALTVYVGTDRLARWLKRRRWSAVTGAVLLATLTPFCSCGTTAVVLGMLAAEAPWAPIVAFMVASPLTSPSELLLSAGLFGWPFALLYFAGAGVLGVAAGGVAGWVADRGWLANQSRMAPATTACAGACGRTQVGDGAARPALPPVRTLPPVATREPVAVSCAATAGRGTTTAGCGATPADPTAVPRAARTGADRPAVPGGPARTASRLATRLRLPELGRESLRMGRRIATYFLAYTALGYLLIEMLPTAGLSHLLGTGAAWAVPLAAVLGVPVYLTSEASLPMVAALMHGGMGAGPAMAFLVTGAGTSIGAISGALLIARWRVVGLVVAMLLVGATVLGWIAALIPGLA